MMIKVEKNYFRNELMGLIPKVRDVPIVVTAKYKHSNHSRWATFTTVRPYIPGRKTRTICNHINIERKTAEKWYNLTEKCNNRKFYLIGHPSAYVYNGSFRGKIELEEGLNIPPIIFTDDKAVLGTVIDACYKFERTWIRNTDDGK